MHIVSAYRLKLEIYPVFHVSLLKRYVGNAMPPTVDLPPISDEGQICVEPEEIVDMRWNKHGANFIAECLVKWKNLPAEDATWEDMQLLKQQFPALNLEDKVPLVRESIDKPRRSFRIPKKNPKFLI